jgi:hypothetical protein
MTDLCAHRSAMDVRGGLEPRCIYCREDPDSDLRVSDCRFITATGSVVVMEGITKDGTLVRFAADHRPARTILEGDDLQAIVPPWAVLFTVTPTPDLRDLAAHRIQQEFMEEGT